MLTDYNGPTVDENGLYYSSILLPGRFDKYYKINNDGYLFGEDAEGYFYRAANEHFLNNSWVIRGYDELGATNAEGEHYIDFSYNWGNSHIYGFLDKINGTEYFYGDTGYIGFMPAANPWDAPTIINSFFIEHVSDSGYAMYYDANKDKFFNYDPSGGLIDETGYVMSKDGTYYVETDGMPWSSAVVGPDGYFYWGINWQGIPENPILDSNNNYISAYGYNEIDDEGYLLDNKQRITVTVKESQWSGNLISITLKAKRGTPLKAATSEDFASNQQCSISYVNLQSADINNNNDIIAYKSFKSGIVLPNNGIWFKPVEPGVIRLLMYGDAVNEKRGGFALIKLKRNSPYPDNPFAIDDIGEGQNFTNSALTVIGDPEQYAVPHNVLVLLELPFEQSDIDNGYEFWITMAGDATYPYFIYMDLGASSTGTVPTTTPTDKADTTKQVTAIDFIYGDVYIAQDGDNVGSFLDPNNNDNIYVETGTMLTFGGSGAIVVFYYRSDDQDKNKNPTIFAAHNGNSLASSNTSKASITTTQKDVKVDGYLQNFGWTNADW